MHKSVLHRKSPEIRVCCARPGDPEKADDFDEVYWSVYLNPFPWYKRLWGALRYVFGHRSMYDSWDSGPMMDSHAIERLRAFLEDVDTKRL